MFANGRVFLQQPEPAVIAPLGMENKACPFFDEQIVVLGSPACHVSSTLQHETEVEVDNNILSIGLGQNADSVTPKVSLLFDTQALLQSASMLVFDSSGDKKLACNGTLTMTSLLTGNTAQR